MSEDEKKICKVCILAEDDYSVEISDGDVCDGCRNLNEKFQIYRMLIAEGVINPDEKHEWVDFSDETLDKYPILKESDIRGEWHLLSQIENRLDRMMNGRMRNYKVKMGKPLYGRTTAIFKRDDMKRKAPLVSATCFNIGDMMPGCKRMGMRASYIVKQRKDGTHFWSKVSNGDKMWKRWVVKNYTDMELSYFTEKYRHPLTPTDAIEKLGELFE